MSLAALGGTYWERVQRIFFDAAPRKNQHNCAALSQQE
jgi:hypothetical protein